MHRLSELVTPTELDTDNVITSPVRLLPQADSKHALYPLVKKYLKRGTTLQILAIRIYLEWTNESDDEAAIDERTLKRDLQRLREWEEKDVKHMQRKEELAAAGNEVSWKAQIPVRKYSESWVPSMPEKAWRSKDSVSEEPQPDEKLPPKK
jgi:hypothetical protein